MAMMVAMEIRHSILRSFIRVHLSSIYNKSSSIGPCRLKHKPRHSVKYEHNIMKYNMLLNSTTFCKLYNEPVHEISKNVVCATSKGSDQPAHMRSLIKAFARRLNIL